MDHLCRRPSCVNPEHLEPVTRSENLRRGNVGQSGLAQLNKAKTHCPKGHPYDEENTYHYKGSRYCRQCLAAKARRKYRRQSGLKGDGLARK